MTTRVTFAESRPLVRICEARPAPSGTSIMSSFAPIQPTKCSGSVRQRSDMPVSKTMSPERGCSTTNAHAPISMRVVQLPPAKAAPSRLRMAPVRNACTLRPGAPW
jgi:hypothetical protein